MLRAWMAPAVGAAALLGVAGCGSSDSKKSDTGGGSSGSSAKTTKVVYIPGLTGNPFYTTVGCGAKSVAQQLNAKFSVQGAAEFDVAKQTAVLSAVAADKPDAIMISNTDPKAMIPPLARAKAGGAKIVMIDGDVEDKGIAVSNIQSNNLEGGRLAGAKMGQLLGGKGSIVVIDNAPGFNLSKQRVDGFKEALKKYPGIKVLPTQYSNNATAKAASITATSAQSNPDVRGVYTVETNNTEGAITGLREAGKSGKVKLIGYDTSDPIVAALHKGTLDANVVQYPFGEGANGLKTAVAAAQGKKVPREQTAPFVIATPDNVDTPKVQKYIYKVHC